MPAGCDRLIQAVQCLQFVDPAPVRSADNRRAVANPDRLTGARRLLPRARGRRRRTCTSAPCMLFEGERARLRRLRRADRARACTSSRATARSSPFPPLGAGRARCGSTTRTSTPATTCATPRCPRPRSVERAAAARRPPVRPAPGPLQAAVGDVARRPRRAATASRSCRKTHHALVDGVSGVDIATVLFDLEPDPPPPPEPPPAWFPRPEPTRRALLADALAERVAVPLDAARARGRRARAPASAPPGGSAGALAGLGSVVAAGLQRRAREPAQRADRAAPALRLGRRRPRRSSRRSRARSAAPSTTSCWPSSRARCARTCRPRARGRRARAQGDGADVGARRGRARRARQPRDRDVRAAAGRRSPTRSSASRSSTRRWRGSRSPARPSAPRRSPSSPASRRRPCSPRPRGCSPRQRAVQPRGDERARPAVPALHARPAPAARSTRRCRCHATPRSGSRSCPTTGRCTSACSATTTRCRTSTTSPPTCATAIDELAAAAGVAPPNGRAPRDRRRQRA